MNDIRELVLFDKDGNEIDWYDPVEDEEIECDGNILSLWVMGTLYEIPCSKYHHYEIRNRK